MEREHTFYLGEERLRQAVEAGCQSQATVLCGGGGLECEDCSVRWSAAAGSGCWMCGAEGKPAWQRPQQEYPTAEWFNTTALTPS